MYDSRTSNNNPQHSHFFSSAYATWALSAVILQFNSIPVVYSNVWLLPDRNILPE